MGQEWEPDAGDRWPAENPPPTRQMLSAQAEALSVALARWKAWRVEGHPHANLQEAQALQALVMALVELLDDAHGSRAAVRAELARALALLGDALHSSGTEIGSQGLWADAEACGDDAAFLRAHGLRFDEGASPDAPVQEP